MKLFDFFLKPNSRKNIKGATSQARENGGNSSLVNCYLKKIDDIIINDNKYTNVKLNHLDDIIYSTKGINYEEDRDYDVLFFNEIICSRVVDEHEKLIFLEREKEKGNDFLRCINNQPCRCIDEQPDIEKHFITYLTKKDKEEEYSYSLLEFYLKNKHEGLYVEIQKYLGTRADNPVRFNYETSIPIALFDLGYIDESFNLLTFFVNEYLQNKIESINDESYFEEINPFAYLALNDEKHRVEIIEMAFNYFSASPLRSNYLLKKFLFYFDKNRFLNSSNEKSDFPIKNTINWKLIQSQKILKQTITNFDKFIAETEYYGVHFLKNKFTIASFDKSLASYPLNYEKLFNRHFLPLFFDQGFKDVKLKQDVTLFGTNNYYDGGDCGYTLNFHIEKRNYSIYFETETNWLITEPIVKIINLALKDVNSDLRLFSVLEDVDPIMVLAEPDEMITIVKELNFRPYLCDSFL